jgi:hypothetical protein
MTLSSELACRGRGSADGPTGLPDSDNADACAEGIKYLPAAAAGRGGFGRMSGSQAKPSSEPFDEVDRLKLDRLRVESEVPRGGGSIGRKGSGGGGGGNDGGGGGGGPAATAPSVEPWVGVGPQGS